jgi:opacity protein-like surface antigen
VAAQTTTGEMGQGYVEAVAQAAFGNVTSQSYGVEVGYSLDGNTQLFVEAGLTRDVATSDLGSNAQVIAGALGQTQSGVSYAVREPVTFGAAGVRYLFDSTTRLRPYLLAGGGIARVRRDVTFAVGGTDVTDTLGQYGIVLGTDLSGSSTRPMLLFGAGAAYPVWRQLLLDFQLRYGRVFAPDHAINVTRAGLGVGFAF